MSKRLLFFFPYVGASSISFKQWEQSFNPELECVTMDYPGHGIDESELSNDLKEIAISMYKKIITMLENIDEYYLCGHCMGALVAYEVYGLLKEMGVKKLPQALFLCSQMSPERNSSDGLSEMDDDELIQYLLDNKLISDVLLQDDMKDYMYNIIINPIRSDEYAADNYKTEMPRNKYDVNTWIIYGNKDKDITEEIRLWDNYFNNVSYIEFDGGHFFPWEDEELFSDEIKDALEL